VRSMGIGDTPQQADLAKIPQGNFMQNRKVCTTLPCLPLLFGNKAYKKKNG